jgi:hypothetical protein
MNSILHSQAFKAGRRCLSRGAPFIAVFALAAQVVAQNPLIPDSVDVSSTATGATQSSAATGGSAQIEISEPAPAAEQEEANLTKPEPIPFLSLEAAQDGGQSSSQSGSTTAATTGTTTKKTKPPHRGLGIALAVVGVTALAAGAVAYGVGKTSLCVNEQSGGCKEARDAGIALMPVGGGVAAIGFYLQFHR